MTKKETAKVMAIFQATYPRYYNDQNEEQKKQALQVWAIMFEEYTYDVVQMAVKAVIATCKYPPTPADVIEKIELLTEKESMSDLKAWDYISRAVSCSIYRSREAWENLPEELKKMVTPNHLYNWATMPRQELQTYVQSDFRRRFREKQEKEREHALLPRDVKLFIEEKRNEFQVLGLR